MPQANYPNGFRGGVQIAGFPVFQMFSTSAGTRNGTNAGVWYVDSNTGADGNKGDTWYAPLATIQGAFTKAKANDIVMVKATHAETVSSATTAAWNVAGVQVIGLGVGNQRPTITIDTLNTGTINVSVASVSVSNCIFVANFLTIAACFTLTTAKDFKVLGCMFKDSAANKNFANIVKSTGAANTADGLTFNDNLVVSTGTTYNTAVLVADAIDRQEMSRNTVTAISTSDIATLGISTTGAVTNALIQDNATFSKATTHTSSLLFLGTGTASTGFILRNFSQSLDAAAAVLVITSLGFSFQGNSISGAIGAQGFPIPALDS